MSSQASLIRDSYNQIAEAYANERHYLKSDKYLRKLEQVIPKQASILDLGCGNGLPVAETLLKKGYLVTGLDISPVQIKAAKKNCPRGEFLVANMQDLKHYEFAVDVVVAFYSIFHLPRHRQLKFLETINTFLPIGGWILITMGDKDFEGFHRLHGAKMWSSHYDTVKNSFLVMNAGFEIELDELDLSSREKHQIILAQKVQDLDELRLLKE